ncbi:hypothetical protein MCEMSEM18_03507 [Comamonadaceae bacterium]
MHHHNDSEELNALDTRLKTEGVTPSSTQQALEWYLEGRRVYCFHEMDEQPMIATSINQIENRTPDHMLVLPNDEKLALLRSASTVVTSDGNRFDLQSDGTWSRGELTFDSLDVLYEANQGNLEAAEPQDADDEGADEPPAYEFRFLDQVRGLVATAARALEEAEHYADMIEDPNLKAQANALLERNDPAQEMETTTESEEEPFVVGYARIDSEPYAIPAYFQPGNNWNGWAMPHFTKEGACWLTTKMPEVRYDAEQDAFICKFANTDPEEPPEVIVGTEIDVPGKGLVKVYPVGAGSLVWDCYLPTESMVGIELPSFSLTEDDSNK